MKQPIKGILKQADHNPVRVGDKILITSQPHGDGGYRPTNPKPRKSLDERITEAMSKVIQPIVTRLDKIESNQQDTNSRLDRLEQRVDSINTIIEYNVQVDILRRPK